MIIGFRDGQGLPGSINGGVHNVEPRESKDDILLATAHDVEEVFLGNPFNICIESTGVADSTSLVHSLINIVNSNGGGKFLSGEMMFPDELPVDAGDVSTRIYQCGEVDNFEGV